MHKLTHTHALCYNQVVLSAEHVLLVVVVVDLDDGWLQLLNLDLSLDLNLPARLLLGHVVEVQHKLVLLLPGKKHNLGLDVSANCICEIHCIALDGFDTNTVHKLSCKDKKSQQSLDSNPGQLGGKQVCFLCAMLRRCLGPRYKYEERRELMGASIGWWFLFDDPPLAWKRI